MPKGSVVNIVSRVGETSVFPILVSEDADTFEFRAANEEKLVSHPTGVGISKVDPTAEGVTRHRVGCSDNAIRGQRECKYDVQWKSGQCGEVKKRFLPDDMALTLGRCLAGCGSGTEDLQKYACLDPTDFLTPENGLGVHPELEILGGLDMRDCEYSICRLLCATPSLEITPYFRTQFEELVGQGQGPDGVCDLIDGKRPDACFALNRTLHVGETLEFELKAESELSEDRIDVQAAVEPGIPIGMDFADAGSSMPGSHSLCLAQSL